MQATDFGPACPQPTQYTGYTKGVRDMDEDCLYLNIYTPDVRICIFKGSFLVATVN